MGGFCPPIRFCYVCIVHRVTHENIDANHTTIKYMHTIETEEIVARNGLRVLCLGDIVGRAGRKVVQEQLPQLRKRLDVHLVIANGENAAGGLGITKETAKELFSAGVDVITTGNHIWRHQECYSFLAKEPKLLRPANYPDGAPGTGLCIFSMPNGHKAAVINLLGRTYMEAVDCPFHTAEVLLTQIPDDVAIIIVDFHAEATSEKRALAHFLDGKVSAVLGTHTHVQTADAMILEQGTAALSDLGMCGCEENSVLGVRKESSIGRFYTGLPHPFTPARGKATINGAYLQIDKISGKALSIGLVRGKSQGVLRSFIE